jgi:ferredoxin
MYQSLLIYYFSGTGNALSAARWIYQNGLDKGISSSLRSIEKPVAIDSPEPGEKRLIAFAYPTHGFIGPWIMLKFMIKFPEKMSSDVIFLNTKGGFKAGRFFIPGVSGLALWFPILLFIFKGYHIRGALPLDMPHSWTSFFPPNSKKASVAITERCHCIVNKMCGKVLSGERFFHYTMWTHLWIDLIAASIVPFYLLGGRFFLAKTLFASTDCNDCRICADNCPVKAIVMKNGMPYWKYNCESCMRCMNICPRKAIQAWVTRILIIGYFLFTLLSAYLNLSHRLIFIIVSLAIFPLYWLFINAVRNSLINRIFTFSSLTKYWKRYLSVNIKISDFNREPPAGKS